MNFDQQVSGILAAFCSEIQLYLTLLTMEGKISQAEELLKSSALDKKEEAVDILIGISKRGDKKATAILAKCLKDRDGINAENEHEVVWCVNTKEGDKRLQYAVEVLYNSLKKNDEDKLALQDIDEALKEAEAKLKVLINIR